MKVLMENWRRFINEAPPEEAAPAPESMEALLGAGYEEFVKHLQGSINDPRVQAVLTGGLKDRNATDDVVKFSAAAPAVASLIPTQKEVDIDKSLAYPLTKEPSQFIEKVSSDGPFTVVEPIIIYAGKYVMDGHHRWSTVYACNRNASIDAVNMEIAGLSPLNALKLIQMAIGVQKKTIPMQFVEGNNLFTMGEEEVKNYVRKKTHPNVYQLILQDQKVLNKIKGGTASKQKVQPKQSELQEQSTSPAYREFIKGDYLPNYIWANIASMRKTSQPVKGAPARGYMPQTGKTGFIEPLKKGMIDIKPPFAGAPVKKEK